MEEALEQGEHRSDDDGQEDDQEEQADRGDDADHSDRHAELLYRHYG